MARGKKWPEPKKARTLKRARQLNKRMGFKMAFQQAADESGIPEETIISWHQKAKAEAQEKEKAEQEKAADWYRGSEGKTETSTARFPIVEPEPVVPYVNTDSGVPFCSRCKNKQIEEQEEGLWFCSVCNTSLPWPEHGDVEIKYRGGSGRHYGKYGWMA
jgi:hypothetical protein